MTGYASGDPHRRTLRLTLKGWWAAERCPSATAHVHRSSPWNITPAGIAALNYPT